MNDACMWCRSTSEQIDSLEHEVEALKALVLALQTELMNEIRRGGDE